MAKDERTKRQKLEDVIRLGATPEEKANAQRLLDRLGPDPNPARARPIDPPYRAPDFSGPIYTHRPAPDPDPTQAWEREYYGRWSEYGQTRPPRAGRPAGYPDYSGLSMDELLRRMSEQMGNFQSTINDRFSADVNMDGGFTRPEDCAGKHDYVVIGTSMFHTDIKRCLRCGEFDPPRRKPDGTRKQGDV